MTYMDDPVKHYSYCVSWSWEDGEHVATCLEIPGLSGLAGTPEGAIAELQVAMGVWLEHLRDAHLPVPQPGLVLSVLDGDFRPTTPAAVTVRSATGAAADPDVKQTFPAFASCVA